ncbi:MAG: phage tail protein [Candidimonas sp.]|nr:MAG: phage tail protein [Candidimonas sp.]TAM23763.1 MAG: phage tail protein [Candidimonas sp.]
MATDNTNRLAGTAYLDVDGKKYLLRGSLNYNPSKSTRETIIGDDGVHGYSEKPFAGMISGKFTDGGGLLVADFNAMTNVTVTVELANGKTVTGRNMWTVDAQEVDSEEASVEVKWEGRSVTESNT